MAQLKNTTKKAPAKKVETTTEEVKKELAQPEPREMLSGKTPSSFRVGKKLTPLRKDYRAGQMSDKDHGFLKDCLDFADSKGQFKRLNADAGRIGRLYTLKFVDFEETGVYDAGQIITLTDNAREFVKPVKAA